MTRAVLPLRLVIVAALLVEHLVLVQWAGPDAEARFFPVLVAQRLGPIERVEDGRRACWTWYHDKVRAAAAVDAGWTLHVAGRSYPYQRVETIADSWEVAPGLVVRPVRRGMWSRKCIDLPEAAIGRPFRLSGFVELRTALTGRWWTIRQSTPEGDAL